MRQFFVKPGGKQVHLGLVPPGAYCLEDLWQEDHSVGWFGLD